MDIVLAITITDSCRFQYYLKFFLLYWCTYLYSTYPLRPKLCYENYGDFRDDLALFTFVGEDLLLDDFISCLGLADLDWDFLKVFFSKVPWFSSGLSCYSQEGMTLCFPLLCVNSGCLNICIYFKVVEVTSVVCICTLKFNPS